jgi:hypothetical protein
MKIFPEVLIALLLMGGCSGQNPRPPMIADLKAAVTVSQNDIQVQYSVQNTSDTDLFVLDIGIQVRNEGTVVGNGPPRVEVNDPARVDLLSKLLPLNPNVDYASPPSAYASFLRKGETRKGVMTLPLPLVPRNLKATKEVGEIICRQVRFTMGVIPAPRVASAEEQEIAGTRVWRLSTDAYDLQQEISVDVPVSGIRVLYPR